MINQRLIWTALPNGLSQDGTKYRLSVFVSPRLFTDEGPTTQMLSAFPDFHRWCDTVITFSVSIGGAIPTPVTVVSPPRSEQLWGTLFHPTTFVEPYEYSSLSDKNFHSYPAKFIRDFHVNTYTQLVSASPTEFPTLGALGLAPDGQNNHFGQLPFNPDEEERAVSVIQSLLKQGVSNQIGGPPLHVIPPASGPQPLTDFEQAKLFLQPLTTVPAAYNGSSHPAKPQIDFHRMISTLGQYPGLLRLFGLVFDLEVPIPAGSPTPVDVSVTPSWTPLLAATTNVVTSTSVDPATFLASPRVTAPEIAGGLLRMSDPVPSVPTEPGYPVVELELDGSALKAVNFAQGVWRANETMASSSTPSGYAPPALRSAGLLVAHTGQALDFGTGMKQADSLDAAAESSAPIELFAEDITRGFRVDVWDDVSNAWHQLCARSAAPTPGGYVIGKSPGAHTVPVPTGDEGWVELSLAQGDAGGSNDAYLSEFLFRWTGWSLVAPRPGQHLAADPHEGLESEKNNPPSGTFPLQVAYAATPGTLPAQRFGRTYRFRARAVDLAGNSIDFDPSATEASFAYATAGLRYGRMQPLQSPPLVPHDPRGELLAGDVVDIISPGEHLERLVIRSEFDNTDDSTVGPTSRHIVPPSVAEELAEAHGALDGHGKTPDPSVYPVIAPLANATYADPAVVTALGGLADPGSSGQFYYPVDNLPVPYLPDVLARGALLQGLPGDPTALSVPFGDSTLSWPQTRGFRLEMRAGSGAPILPAVQNNFTLTVFAPKATFQTMRLSCYMNPSDLDSMGLWEWLEEKGLDTPLLRALSASGRVFWFTPYREITFVHAVRQPLTIPQFTAPTIGRELGKTFALLSDTIDVDFKSSQKLDVYSIWDEPFDDGINPTGAVILSFNASVGEIKLDPADDTATSVVVPSAGPPAIPALRHDFGDTKYRHVLYEARSTSRFLEYFQVDTTVTLTNATPTTVDAGGLATGTVVVSSASTPRVVYAPTVDYIEDDVAGTIAAVEGGAIIPKTGGTKSVDVRYVPPPVTRSSLEAIDPPATATGYPLDVLSTARPAAPDLRYVLPLFSFTDSTGSSPPSIQSTRKGNAVRVYLGRPWFSSGEGEQLGVVIYPTFPGIPPVPPPDFEPFATRYGRDPLFVTNQVQIAPSVENFTAATATASGLTLPETGATPAWAVAAHDVQFDTTHQLWFADIEVDTSAPAPQGIGNLFSYWPFIRMGLVRYQAKSLTGVECSTVVQADFVKLASDRVATLTFSGNTVSISVSGVDYSAGPAPLGGTSIVTATVETELSGVTDPDLQWQAVPGSAVQLSSFFSGTETATWNGTVTLPAARGSQPFRIRIEEFELIPSAPPGLFVPPPARRRTYIDTIQI